VVPRGAIGFHFHDQSWAACGDEDLFEVTREHRACLIPVTHYNGDYRLLGQLSQRLPVPVTLVPRLPPAGVLNEISRLRAFVSSSLHAAIFAYASNVPFLAFGYPEKIVEFMQDRGLDQWIVRDKEELRRKLPLLLEHPPDYSDCIARDRERVREHFRRIADCIPRIHIRAPHDIGKQPPLEHKLLVDHQNRLAVLERATAELALQHWRVRQDTSRQASRLDLFRRHVEGPSAYGDSARGDLPFGQIDSPPFGSNTTNTIEASGWALCQSGIAEVVAYVDSTCAGTAEYGLVRPDVTSAYPGFRDSRSAGWRMLIEVDGLSEGAHELVVQARSTRGTTRDLGTVTFYVGAAARQPSPHAAPGPKHIDERSSQIIDATATAVDELRRRVKDLGAGADEVRARFEAGQEEVRWVSAQVDSLTDEVVGLRARTVAVEHSYRAHHDAVESLAESISDVSERVTRNAGCTEGRLHRHETSVLSLQDGSARLNQQLSELTRLTSALSDRIDDLYRSRIWRTLRALAAPLGWVLTGNRSAANAADSVRPPCTGTAENDNCLRVGVDSPIPTALKAEKGTVLCIHGWCYHSVERIRSLEISVNGVTYPVRFQGGVRADVYSAHYPGLDPRGHSYRSGFWSFAPISSSSEPGVELLLRATLQSGRQCATRIGEIVLESGTTDNASRRESRSGPPLVTICLATSEPPLHLFERQIDSLIRQSYQNWICIISDDFSSPGTWQRICAIARRDPRFQVHRTSQKAGFYGNFEHCLSLVPSDADFVALCDHDDWWRADKLEKLVGAFNPATTLVYSDMRIVDESGQVLSETYWTTRRNNYRHLTTLFIANTVTGAASVFRRDLLRFVLPFPRPPGQQFHDHWIACVALALGDISYVNLPLYDYVQHGGNVIGHYTNSASPWWRSAWTVLRNPSAVAGVMSVWRAIHFGDVLRIALLAEVIALRAGPLVRASRRRTIERLRRLDSFPAGALLMSLHRVTGLWRGNETLAAETRLLRGILWRRCSALRGRFGGRPRPATPNNHATASVPGPQQITDTVEMIRAKVAPLRLAISANFSRRVNVLIPTVDFNYVFAGYIGKFNLARALSHAGFNVRIVILDYCDFQPGSWRRQLRGFEGVRDMLDCCELAYAFDRTKALEVNPSDCFVATTWWTAHVARRAVEQLGQRAFIYLIQEYEPFTFPMGSLACLAEETYSWPHYALFSTEFLRDYFLHNKLGVFSSEAAAGGTSSAVFRNAITEVGPVSLGELQKRTRHRLLFYARPEPHAARNMFEMGVLALCQAIEAGVFAEDWEFTGIGSVGLRSSIPLSSGRRLDLVPRQSQTDYRELLRDHDVGLSLMYTPHPSLVPIEMAAAAMVVVTNTFANKSGEALRAVSSNFIAVRPAVGDIVEGLGEAVGRVDQLEARIKGSEVGWPRSWQNTYDRTFIRTVADFVEQATGAENTAAALRAGQVR
jgi:glycosyltransferase involved in cell wall biosynthesis